ncbi:HipA domain-containing protein [Aggregatibacter actinomycetemcomitans]|nr:HipA domain-containing protein [Aggregatibacter actinomycetemcomitans]
MEESEDFRISLAGVQEKTALLYLLSKSMATSLTFPATSYIFKLPIGMVVQGQLDLSSSCENEWIYLNIMKAFGLPVPNSKIHHFGDTKVLIVERFDRRWSEKGNLLIRLPQEDMCQALNIAPARKYENDGTPAFSRLCRCSTVLLMPK